MLDYLSFWCVSSPRMTRYCYKSSKLHIIYKLKELQNFQLKYVPFTKKSQNDRLAIHIIKKEGRLKVEKQNKLSKIVIKGHVFLLDLYIIIFLPHHIRPHIS